MICHVMSCVVIEFDIGDLEAVSTTARAYLHLCVYIFRPKKQTNEATLPHAVISFQNTSRIRCQNIQSKKNILCYLKKECYWTRPNIFDLRCLYFVGENDQKKGEEIFTFPNIVMVHWMHKF